VYEVERAIAVMSNVGESMFTALRDHPFLSDMPVSSLRRLARDAYRAEFSSGETIFREHGFADRFFLIREGLVRLDTEVAGRGSVNVETVGADAALGWSWLLAPYRWHLTATAVERTFAIVLDASTLRSLMAADPSLGYELMRRLAAVIFDRLEATRARFAEEVVMRSEAATIGPWAGVKTKLSSLP
jgi:CRP-like cAMP-binding protein